MTAPDQQLPAALASGPRHGLRALVTGAAGLIGSELCGRLAERGHGVIALVHRTQRLVRNDGRVLQPTRWSRTSPGPGVILAFAADVRRPDFGLAPETAAALASGIDVVIHCAAATGFQLALEVHRSVNVDGTAHILAFMRRGTGPPPGLVHVSTAYVSGDRSGPIGEDASDLGQVFANGYEATKAEAEVLVRASGLPAAIARPSIVVGTSETGEIGRFEHVYALLKLIGSGRIAVLPATPGATLDLVPIDHVVDGLVDMVERFEGATGRTFHLVSGDPTPVAALVALDYPGFHVPRLVAPDRFDPSSLDPLAAMIYENVTSLYAAYLRADPRFASDNLRALSGRVCPPTGPGFLRRIVDYATAAGFLRPNLT